MTKKYDNKRQHWVPQSYLSAWIDPECSKEQEGYVWKFPKEGGNGKNKAPKKIFRKKDMYTINLSNGDRDLSIEHGLSGLENKFSEVRKQILNKKQKFDDESKIIIATFVAASFCRTESMERHQKKQWGKSFDMMKQMKKNIETASPEQKEVWGKVSHYSNGPSYTMNDIQRRAENPLQESLISFITAQAELLIQMKMSIFCTDDKVGFITSDSPCVWFDPSLKDAHPMFRSPGLGSPTIEVTLPISPNQLVVITHSRMKEYFDIPLLLVDEINRRTRFYADKSFIVRKNTTKDVWFQN